MENIEFCKQTNRKIKLIISYICQKSTYFNEVVSFDIEMLKNNLTYKSEDEIFDIINSLCNEGYLIKDENNTYKATIKGFQFYLECKMYNER